MPSVSDYIKLSADEYVVKEYRGFEMKKPQKAALNIAVTSKRLILYGMTKAASKMNRPSLTQEMKLEDIRGLEIYEKKPQSLFFAVLGGLILLTGLFGIYSPTTSFFFPLNAALKNQIDGGILVAALGILVFLISFIAGSKETVIILKGKNENLNSGIFNEKTKIKWGSDSQKILCELGSVILGIQQRTEAGIGNSYETDSPNYSGYDDVFEGSDDFRDDDKADSSMKEQEEEYTDSSDLSDYPEEKETGKKKDDYLF